MRYSQLDRYVLQDGVWFWDSFFPFNIAIPVWSLDRVLGFCIHFCILYGSCIKGIFCHQQSKDKMMRGTRRGCLRLKVKKWNLFSSVTVTHALPQSLVETRPYNWVLICQMYDKLLKCPLYYLKLFCQYKGLCFMSSLCIFYQGEYIKSVFFPHILTYQLTLAVSNNEIF